MRFRVEPSPAGGYLVMAEDGAAPLSRHDTEEEALERATAYTLGAAGAAAEEIELRDGARVLVRPLQPDDKGLLAAGFDRLSPESRYLRFFGAKKRLSPDELQDLTEIDHTDHEALGALDPATGLGVGVARFIRDPSDPGSAEAAVTVADDWQGRGLGTALLRRLVVRAREEGVERFVASLFVENRDMLEVFRRVGEVSVTRTDGTAREIEVELPVDGEPLGRVLKAAAKLD